MKLMISVIREAGDKDDSTATIIDAKDGEHVLNFSDNGNVVVELPKGSYIQASVNA